MDNRDPVDRRAAIPANRRFPRVARHALFQSPGHNLCHLDNLEFQDIVRNHQRQRVAGPLA